MANESLARRAASGANRDYSGWSSVSSANDNAVDAPAHDPGPDRMAAQLAPYGLQAMAPRAWDYYQANQPSEAEFMAWLREQPEYKTRFPAMEELGKRGWAKTEAEYIAIEQQYATNLSEYGIPKGFYDDPSDFTAWMLANKSPNEIRGRLEIAKQYLYTTPPEVRAEAARLGFVEGDLIANLLDPEKALPLLQQQFLAAQTGAGARMAGYGMLTTSEAEQLAQLGVGFDQARQGFGQLVQAQELFTPMIGDQGETAIGREEQIGAVGGNPAAARRIADRARKRQAEFESGGRFSSFGTADT